MRIGKNPNRHKEGYSLAPVWVAVVVHLPGLGERYHTHRLEIVKLSLRSLRRNAYHDFKLLVWDNGSYDYMHRWLDSFWPDMLIHSENVGKKNAQAAIFRMLPEDTVIAYADDDMFYYPYWLRKQIAVLNAYPDSIVTGYPTREAFHQGRNEHTVAWAEENAEVSRGDFIPQEWTDQHAESIGCDPVSRRYQNQDIKIRYNGVSAFATSHHCQFIAKAGVVRDYLPYSDLATAKEWEFDKAIDQAGILRLATTERLTRHMGNVLDDDLRQYANDNGLQSEEHTRAEAFAYA